MEGSMGMLIEVKDLGKRYSAKADFTIQDINIKGYEGEIIAVLGHNGAGKSTTIKCITGMHPYEAGTIKIAGYDLTKESIRASRISATSATSTFSLRR